MLKVDKIWLDQVEKTYPGIIETIHYFENASLPACSKCGSPNTAKVSCGIIGRSIHIAAATTKSKLLANGPMPGKYFCNACDGFFD